MNEHFVEGMQLQERLLLESGRRRAHLGHDPLSARKRTPWLQLPTFNGLPLRDDPPALCAAIEAFLEASVNSPNFVFIPKM